MKLFIRVGVPSIAAALALLAAGLGFLLTRTPPKQLKYRTQAALLRAVPATATDELRGRGVQLTAPLACAPMPEATPKKMRVACTGKAQGHRAVQIVAAGEVKTQDQYFTILVNGRPVLQNAGCLGADCRHKK